MQGYLVTFDLEGQCLLIISPPPPNENKDPIMAYMQYEREIKRVYTLIDHNVGCATMGKTRKIIPATNLHELAL